MAIPPSTSMVIFATRYFAANSAASDSVVAVSVFVVSVLAVSVFVPSVLLAGGNGEGSSPSSLDEQAAISKVIRPNKNIFFIILLVNFRPQNYCFSH